MRVMMTISSPVLRGLFTAELEIAGLTIRMRIAISVMMPIGK